jgi:Winged helix DNA-binding domain
MHSWTASEALGYRLKAQHLSVGSARTPQELVGELAAVQAQDYYGALWAVGQRTGNNAMEVASAFNTGTLIRTHLLRPTWHFVAAEDLRWLLLLTGERVQRFNGTMYRKLGLEPSHFRRANRVFERELADGKPLDRAALSAALQRARIDVSDMRLVHLLMDAELTGLLCSGPRRGKQFTYMLLEERVPKAEGLDKEAALFELARRYFRTRCPATVQDFAWWSGLSVSDGKKATAALGKEFVEVSIDDRAYWMPREAEPVQLPKHLVRLLPNYDEYAIGFNDRRLFHDPSTSASAPTSTTGSLRHMMVIDGRVAGTWDSPANAGEVMVSPFSALSSPVNLSVSREIGRYRTFLGL